jgi:type IV pilus assembly protein PilM
MLKTKSFLAIDCGAGTLKIAEFDINEQGGLTLKNYGLKSLGLEGSQETARERALAKGLGELIAERGFVAKAVNISAPGYHVFSKFVKLPPVDTSKVTQIIQYEAQQNVPFPLAEVVWDYQILGAAASGELEVLLVAIKKEIVEGLSRSTQGQGLRMQLADVSTAALCNAFRYNYGDEEQCVMLLDIGAKTSNLLFFEKGKVYARSINIGANSITQDFGNESKIRFAEAEEIKVKDGFVGLGGAYEDPDNPNQAKISKIARQFMTRLHIQMNQTLQFWRGQQGGSAPTKLYLAGGASTMAYTAQFFAEKFSIPVEYFNPLRNVQIDPGVDVEALSHVAHCLGETVGLGLRNLAHCPVELNLMPESTVRAQQLKQKQPYLIATVFSLVLVVFSVGWVFKELAGLRQVEADKIESQLVPLRNKQNQFKREYTALHALTNRAGQMTQWMEDRYYWTDLFQELRRCLIQVEKQGKSALQADVGVWVDEFLTMERNTNVWMNTVVGIGEPVPDAMRSWAYSASAMRAMRRSPSMTPRYSPSMMPRSPSMLPRPGIVDEAVAAQPVPAAPALDPVTGLPIVTPTLTGIALNTNSVEVVTVMFRAVDRSAISASANTTLAYDVHAQLMASSMFDTNATRLLGQISPVESGTFTFGLNLKPKRPLKL